MRSLARQHGKTMRGLADAVGRGRTTVYRRCDDEWSLGELRRAAAYLGVPLGEITSGKGLR